MKYQTDSRSYMLGRHHKLLWLTLLVGLSFLTWGCGDSKKQINIKIRVVDTSSQPISGVSIYSNETALWGYTNEEGLFEDKITTTKPAYQLRFSFENPEGYVFTGSEQGQDENGYQIVTTEETILNIPEESEALVELKYVALFEPSQRDYLFIVEGDKGDAVAVGSTQITTLDKSKRAVPQLSSSHK